MIIAAYYFSFICAISPSHAGGLIYYCDDVPGNDVIRVKLGCYQSQLIYHMKIHLRIENFIMLYCSIQEIAAVGK